MIQQGARRNYVYARQLEDAGLLHSLVTDFAIPSGSSGLISRVIGSRVTRRTVKGIPANRVLTSVLPNVAAGIAKKLFHEEVAYGYADAALALSCRLRAFRDVKVVVNYHGNGGSLLDVLKKQGARIATDFIITPDYLEIEKQERHRWPAWEMDSAGLSVIELYRRRMSHLVQISDLYLCPSQTVVRDLAKLPGFDPARVRLVPYGLSGALVNRPATEAGRVLFSGAACLRKGLPYLAQAATLLKQRQPAITVCIAGHAPAHIRALPDTRDLVFLGTLPRERMAQEYARADMFCLPSLAEGSASSIYEAMASGLPVITTSSSGSVVEDGVEGFIVPERDPVALADAMLKIFNDRDLRQRLSAAAVATAARYDDKTCGETFLSAIRELL